MNTTALGRVIPFPQPSKSAKLKRGRPTDAAQGRTRSSLTPGEVGKLIKAARSTGRYGHRDATLILLAYRHGLRVSELIAMRWDQVDFHQGLLAVVRRERGVPSTHPLSGTELRALRRLKREQPRPRESAWVPNGAWRATECLHGAPRGATGKEAGRYSVLGATAPATAFDGVQVGECWHRYTSVAALPWASEHPAHGKVYGARRRAVQRTLGRLSRE